MSRDRPRSVWRRGGRSHELPTEGAAVTVRAKKPVCGGDWVTTTSGVYGYVDEFTRQDQVRIVVVLEFDPTTTRPTPSSTGSLSASASRCRACAAHARSARPSRTTPRVGGGRSARSRSHPWTVWSAARFAGSTCPLRCSGPNHRFGVGRGPVAIGQVEGSSCETPFAFDAVQFGGGWCISYAFYDEPLVEAVAS